MHQDFLNETPLTGTKEQRKDLSDRAKKFLHDADNPLYTVLTTITPNDDIFQCYMWYLLVADNKNGAGIILNTTKERPQYRNILKYPKMRLFMGEKYQYVSIKGTCTMIDESKNALSDILLLATKYDGQDAAMWYYTTTMVSERRVTFYIRIDSVYEYFGIDNRLLFEHLRIKQSILKNE